MSTLHGSTTPRILVSEVDDHGLVTVSIDRPDRMNALGEAEHDALTTLWAQFDLREDVKAIIVTGGEKAFSAGGDLDWVVEVANDDEVRANAWWSARGIIRGLLDCRKPVLVALEGVSVGAGTAIALTADICIASSTAKIVDGHLPFGASPGDHASFLWPLAMGINRARGRLLLGESLTGAEAAELGLVYEAVPPGTTLERATELARRIASYDSFAVAATKVSVNGVLRQHWQTFEAGLALEFMCFTNQATRGALARAADRNGSRSS